MPITGNATYIPTMNEFIAHWGQCNAALAQNSLTVRLPDNTVKTRGNFIELRELLQTQQNLVQSRLIGHLIVRGNLMIKKVGFLAQLNEFNSLLDGDFQNTGFLMSR